jgi:hypothetical protein
VQQILDIDHQQPELSGGPLVNPEASTPEELAAIRKERQDRDEAILRGSEAWGAAPYAERYPSGRNQAQKPAKPAPPPKLPKKPKRPRYKPTLEDLFPNQYGDGVAAGGEAIPARPKSFQESEHPRDDHGRFADEGGTHIPPTNPPKPGWRLPWSKPAGPPPKENFATIEHVHAWAQKKFPKAFVSVGGIHPHIWSGIANVVNEFIHKHPEIAKRITSFGVTPHYVSENVIAVSSDRGDRLEFNHMWFNNPQKIEKEFKKSVKSGWHPSGMEVDGQTYAIRHELGHLFDFHLTQTNKGLAEQLKDMFAKPMLPGGTIRELDKDKASTISEYAATNVYESFAEAYAAAQSSPSPANPIIKKFKEALHL